MASSARAGAERKRRRFRPGQQSCGWLFEYLLEFLLALLYDFSLYGLFLSESTVRVCCQNLPNISTATAIYYQCKHSSPFRSTQHVCCRCTTSSLASQNAQSGRHSTIDKTPRLASFLFPRLSLDHRNKCPFSFILACENADSTQPSVPVLALS